MRPGTGPPVSGRAHRMSACRSPPADSKTSDRRATKEGVYLDTALGGSRQLQGIGSIIHGIRRAEIPNEIRQGA
jgi:hypothetical protein